MSASQSLGDFNKLYNSCNTNINNSGDAQSLYVWRVRHTLWHNQKLETCKFWFTTLTDNQYNSIDRRGYMVPTTLQENLI